MRDAGLHVEHARSMQAAARPRQRHAVELADRPDRVEMAEQQNLRRAAAKLREQVIAAIGSRQSRHPSSDRLEPRGERGAAPVDGGLVGRRRLERRPAPRSSRTASRGSRGRNRGGL